MPNNHQIVGKKELNLGFKHSYLISNFALTLEGGEGGGGSSRPLDKGGQSQRKNVRFGLKIREGSSPGSATGVEQPGPDVLAVDVYLRKFSRRE